jgi:transcriptional regulator with XRE-family HTH domain
MDEFSTRLKELLDYLNVTPVNLAEKMGVQRTSFNHLLSGRNKPGFEFLTRLHSCYPTINLNWLISGYGSMTENNEFKISPIENIIEEPQSGIDLFSNIFQTQINDPNLREEGEERAEQDMKDPDEVIIDCQMPPSREESIDRMILVYSNGKIVEIKP